MQYFRRRPLRGYTIEWGRRRKLAPKEYFVFGTIQEDDRIIRIHPRLDAAFVPMWFLEYVIYHEMLHSVVPDEIGPTGRRKVHTEEFNRREQDILLLPGEPDAGGGKPGEVSALKDACAVIPTVRSHG